MTNEELVAKSYVEAAYKAGEDEWRAEANAKGLIAALKVYELVKLRAQYSQPTFLDWLFGR